MYLFTIIILNLQHKIAVNLNDCFSLIYKKVVSQEWDYEKKFEMLKRIHRVQKNNKK